jgi:hypothetical protein
MTSWMQMQGMSMGGAATQGEQNSGQQCKRKGGGLGGMLGGVLGGGGGC